MLMAAEDILVKFFIILTILFLFPKVINRIMKTPRPGIRIVFRNTSWDCNSELLLS